MLLGQKVNPRVATHAHAAGGRRPALGIAASGLDRSRRSGDQDPGTARDHRLGEADLREGRRDARVQRREARGACRRRRRRGRRHAGRHGGDADGVHRARRHSDARGGAPGRRCARRSEHARQGAADRFRRHPHRRRRGQGAGDGRGRGVDRPGRADGARLQQRHATLPDGEHVSALGGLRALGTAPGFLPSLPHRKLPGRRDDAGCRCSNNASIRRWARSG